MKTIYTELLEAAMKVAEEGEKTAPSKADRLEWSALNRACRLEMYRTRGHIKYTKKDLTTKSANSTMKTQHSDVGPTSSGARLKGESNYE